MEVIKEEYNCNTIEKCIIKCYDFVRRNENIIKMSC